MARLLTTSGIEADAQVRLAHQRVLEDWARARTIVAESADFYRIRADLEESRRKWETGKRRGEFLLPRGLPLAEAESIVGKYGDELTPEVLAYVPLTPARQSRADDRLGRRGVFLLVLAVAATGAGILAYREQQAAIRPAQAEATLAAATETANSLVFDLAQRFRNAVGVPAALIKDILDKALALQEQLIKSGQVTPDLKRSEAAALDETVDTLLVIGDTKGALAAADQARQILADLLAASPAAPTTSASCRCRTRRSATCWWRRAICRPRSTSYQAGLAIAERLAKSDPGNAGWQRDLSVSYDKVGDVQMAQGNLPAALTSYQASLAIMRAPGEVRSRQCRLAARSVGVVRQGRRRAGGAGQSAGGARPPIRRASPSPSAWRSPIPAMPAGSAICRCRTARSATCRWRRAICRPRSTSYQASLAIIERLAKSDPGNAGWQRDLSVSYEKVGDVQVAQGDLPARSTSYQASLAIAERLAQVRSRQCRLAARSVGVVREGRRRAGGAGRSCRRAEASYQASLAITERLAKSDPGNAGWQRDLSVSYEQGRRRAGGAGQSAGALKSYQAEPRHHRPPGEVRSRQCRLAARSVGVVREGRRRAGGAGRSARRAELLSGELRHHRAPGEVRSRQCRLAARSVGVVREGRRRAGGAGRPCGRAQVVSGGASPSWSGWRSPIPAMPAGSAILP